LHIDGGDSTGQHLEFDSQCLLPSQ
jgi:hypothetical protein